MSPYLPTYEKVCHFRGGGDENFSSLGASGSGGRVASPSAAQLNIPTENERCNKNFHLAGWWQTTTMKFEFCFVCSNNGPGVVGRIQIRRARGAYQLLILLHNLSTSNQHAATDFLCDRWNVIGGGCRCAHTKRALFSAVGLQPDACFLVRHKLIFFYKESDFVDVKWTCFMM